MARLEAWFLSQCDGDWEHGSGVNIETLDNPGWKVVIDLEDTELEDAPFAEIKHNEIGHNFDDGHDWLICRKTGKTFDGAGGPQHLGTIIEVFLSWAEAVAEPSTV